MFGLFQKTSRDGPLTNARSMRAWVSRLPANDPVAAVEAMIALLADPATTEGGFGTNRLKALLELDRLSVPLQERLEAQHDVPALSDDVRERLWRACDNLARAFAQIFERISEELGNAAGDQPHAALHGVFARFFYYTGVQARHGLFRYEQWIPGRWRALHNAYTEACKHAVVAEPYLLDAADRSSPPLSPEQEYLQILLVQRLNTGNLSAHQIDLAAAWLRDWVQHLRLAIRQPEGDGYWLDLGRGAGLLATQPEAPKGELLYLDMGPLREKLAERLARLAHQVAAAGGLGAAQPDAVEQLDLARRLDALWLPSAQPHSRRGERHLEQRAVTVAIGWRDIADAVAAGQTDAATRTENPPEGFRYDDYGRLRQDQERKTSGAVGRHQGRDVWQIHDASDSGFRVRASTSMMAGHRLGALLVLRLEGDTRWQVGIVRRIKKLNAEQIELGVEVIARNATLVVPRSLDARSSGYSVDGIDIGVKAKSFSALYLPGQPRLRGGAQPSLVLPPAEFTVGRPLSMRVAGNFQDVVLAPPLERSKDWVWTTLAIDREGSRVEHAE